MKRKLLFTFTLLMLLTITTSTSLYGRISAIANNSSDEPDFLKHSIESATELDYIWDLVAVDVDNDQDMDIVGAPIDPGKIVWWENDGTPDDGGWIQHEIGNVGNVPNIAIADFDGDQDLDLVMPYTYYAEKLIWFENDGTPENGGWIEHTITSEYSTNMHDVDTADLDGDGDVDIAVISGGNGQVHWFENDGTPADGGWVEHVITFSDDNESIKTVDIDLDGDFDLLVATNDEQGTTERTLYYLRNDGEGNWSEQVPMEAGVSAPGYLDVDAGDVDNDGDLDLLASGYHIHLYENDGTSSGWDDFVIDTHYSLWLDPIYFADMDNDSDLDVIGVGGTFGTDEIIWWENDGSPWDGTWTSHVIEEPFDSPRNADVSDIDGDGDLDVLAADYDGGLFWWEQGGQSTIFLPLVVNQN